MHLFGDLRYAWRSIVRMRAVAVVIIGSIAVGIGANTVVFSWLESIVFNPLPAVPGSGSLHLVEPRNDAGVYIGVSWPEYRDLRERVRTFDQLLAFRMVPLYVGEPGRVERASGLLVSDNYFGALGLAPAAGRFPRADEMTAPGGPQAVVISYDYWQTRFGGSPNAVAERLRVNGVELAIVGVAPRGFKGTIMRLTFDLWLPATLAPVAIPGSRELDDRGVRGYQVTGRLARGVTRSQAQADVSSVMRQLAAAYPQSNRSVGADVIAFWSAPVGPQRLLATSLEVLQGIMLLLLLAVCGNTANLVLARATARQREMSVRQALGAGRWRIARLLLVENLLMALIGGAIGGALATWGTHTLNAMPPLRVRGIPISFETSVDGWTLVFAVALAAACGIAFGLAPAIQLARLDGQASLRAGTSTPPRSRLRYGLIGAEVALASAILIAAGLFLRGFMATKSDDTGFKRDGVLLAGFDLSARPLPDAALREFPAALLDRLAHVPSIERAAIATSVPLDIHGMPMRAFTLEGHARTDDGFDEALADTVTPGYFDVMKIPILEGRDFAPMRDTAAPPQAIVNQAFVRRYLDGADAIGRRVGSRGRQYVIAGVVRDSLYNAFGEPPTPILYFSLRDRPSAIGDIHVRVRSGAETAAASEIRRAVRELDPELPVYDVRTLNDHIESNLIFRRMPARMFGVLAPLLLLLAATGIYAVVAYGVSLRTPEFGIRLALGATARGLVARCVADHLLVIGSGALAGWLLAFAVVVDLLSAPVDLAVFLGVPVVLAAVATLASWWPARRIAAVDPLVALRAE
jgi:putative ABC transport system permease protein